jgi:hypothetical protein
MKPIIIVRADKFDLKLTVDENYNYVYYLMLVVLGYRMIPYHSEKYVTIMDFNDMEFSKIPFKYLYEMFSKMNIYYCGNSQRAFVYNSKGILVIIKVCTLYGKWPVDLCLNTLKKILSLFKKANKKRFLNIFQIMNFKKGTEENYRI